MGCPFSPTIQRRDRRRRYCDPFVLGTVRNAFAGHQDQGGGHAAVDVQLPGGVFAMTIHGAGLDAQFTRDLLGVEVRMDQAEALTLSLGQHRHLFHNFHSPNDGARCH